MREAYPPLRRNDVRSTDTDNYGVTGQITNPWEAQGTWEIHVVHGSAADGPHGHTISGDFRARRVDHGREDYLWLVELDRARFLTEEPETPSRVAWEENGRDVSRWAGFRKVRKGEHRRLMVELREQLVERYGPLCRMGVTFRQQAKAPWRDSLQNGPRYGLWPALERLLPLRRAQQMR